MANEWELKHVGKILDDLSMDGFTARLIRLIYKCDQPSRGKLRESFPDEVAAVEALEAEDKEPIGGLMTELEELVLKADAGNLRRLQRSLDEEVGFILTRREGNHA